jgi:hypothetical protein
MGLSRNQARPITGAGMTDAEYLNGLLDTYLIWVDYDQWRGWFGHLHYAIDCYN